MARAVILDCEGPILTDEERSFFCDVDPWGFILFARHCQSPDQMRALCADLRDAVGRAAPILIDQEGGRVARMQARHHGAWATHPPADVFGRLWRLDPARARKAAWLNGYFLARMVADGGVTFNCVPVLDVPQIDSDPVTLGDRTLAKHPDIIVELGQAMIDGTMAGGVQPVMKHLPGLGRSQCDSHKALPVVEASLSDLQQTDFLPFEALNETRVAMTAHVTYTQIDPDQCATHSPIVVGEVIRGQIGFDGLLITDDLKMEALGGDYASRAQRAIAAGCDVALACNMSLDDRGYVAAAVPMLAGKAKTRAERAARSPISGPISRAMAEIEETFADLCTLLKPVWQPGLAPAPETDEITT
ncbi:MAG: beta-N-acetylhexosaminidase [Pseudomonadota bacterium]